MGTGALLSKLEVFGFDQTSEYNEKLMVSIKETAPEESSCWLMHSLTHSFLSSGDTN